MDSDGTVAQELVMTGTMLRSVAYSAKKDLDRAAGEVEKLGPDQAQEADAILTAVLTKIEEMRQRVTTAQTRIQEPSKV